VIYNIGLQVIIVKKTLQAGFCAKIYRYVCRIPFGLPLIKPTFDQCNNKIWFLCSFEEI